MPAARLIVEGRQTPHFRLDGPDNMAIDEVLLRSAAERSATTLRFYGWKPATLSLGYFQSYHERDQHASSREQDCVRRASGGGAILHDRELTYCLATPSTSRFGDAEVWYAAFHETLVELLSDNGIEARRVDSRDAPTDDAFLCFQRRAMGDVVLDGFKICGSAQRRWKSGLLQHGSLLLRKSEHAPELPGLRDLANLPISDDDLLDGWLQKLTSRLNFQLTPSVLTDKEVGQANLIRKEKFGASDWTLRR